MNKKDNLELLPLNFRHEKRFLLKNHFSTWSKLRKLKDTDINFIISKDSLCTVSRLKKIRAIAIFIYELQINPQQAYLLLHCGVGSLEALSILDAHDIEKRIGRLERGLNIQTKTKPSLLLIKEWINKAKSITGG